MLADVDSGKGEGKDDMPVKASPAGASGAGPKKAAPARRLKKVKKAGPAHAAKATAKAGPDHAPPHKAPPSRVGRRLAGIRAAADELGRTLDEVEKVRNALVKQFRESASKNLGRARTALESINRVARSSPLLDARRLERDASELVAAWDALRTRESGGRKRDILTLDEFFGKAAKTLEAAAASRAAEHLRLLEERVGEMEDVRGSIEKAVDERFRTRMQACRHALASISEAAARMNEGSMDRISAELERALELGKSFSPGRLEGRPEDLYVIDGLLKQVARRMGRVQDILSVKTEQSDG